MCNILNNYHEWNFEANIIHKSAEKMLILIKFHIKFKINKYLLIDKAQKLFTLSTYWLEKQKRDEINYRLDKNTRQC